MEFHVDAAANDDGEPTYPVGDALRALRLRCGFSAEAASAAVHVSERVLHHVEGGLRIATTDLLDDLATLYGVTVERLETRPHAPRIAPGFDLATKTLWLGWIPIVIDERADNEFILRSVALSLRTMRRLDETQPVFLRQREIPLIASLLDLSDRELACATMTHFKLSWLETAQLVMSLREHQPVRPECADAQALGSMMTSSSSSR